MYYLIVIKITGLIFSQDATFTKMEMNNEKACAKAAQWVVDNSSSHIGAVCISKETGETMRFKK